MSHSVSEKQFPVPTVPAYQMVAPPNRLVWLDLTRLLCALLILGIHWLRACYNVHAFGERAVASLVMDFQSHNAGLGMLPYLLVAGTGHSLAIWLTNGIGLFGEFGWEGVSALIIISGFSLTISLKNRSLRPVEWLNWLAKRAVRILVPFYLVAIPFLLAYLALLAVVTHLHGALAMSLTAKLHSLMQTPALGVVLSHTLLVNPFSHQLQPTFFAPAWWFIPSILVAYAVFPILYLAARDIGRMPILLAAAIVSIVSYHFVDFGRLVNEHVYYIALQECFNLTLGIVVGQAWLDARGRARVERVISSRWAFPLAFLLFALGNLANWSLAARPVASMLFGVGLLVMLVVIAKQIERLRAVNVLLRVDAYDLYLVHQPFAFPLALAARVAFHGYAVFIGWFVFVAVAVAVSMLLSAAQGAVFRKPSRLAVRAA